MAIVDENLENCPTCGCPTYCPEGQSWQNRAEKAEAALHRVLAACDFGDHMDSEVTGLIREAVAGPWPA